MQRMDELIERWDPETETYAVGSPDKRFLLPTSGRPHTQFHDAATYILFTSGKNRVKNLNPKFEGGHYAAKL
jgi:hypothetical protein